MAPNYQTFILKKKSDIVQNDWTILAPVGCFETLLSIVISIGLCVVIWASDQEQDHMELKCYEWKVLNFEET
jgi:hypothetical protein